MAKQSGRNTRKDGIIKKERLIKRLRRNYRLVIMNDENFEIKTSLKLTRLNVLFAICIISVIYIVVIIALIVKTPLKEQIPGYEYSAKLNRNLINTYIDIDSVKWRSKINDQYVTNIQRHLAGNYEIDTARPDTSTINYDNIELGTKNPEDSILRAQFEAAQNYSLYTNVAGETNLKILHFFNPVNGVVTKHFDPIREHYGIDIVAQEDSPIKATLDGKVIFTGWTAEDGHVIAIQHNMGIVSFYKHNSMIFKKVGNFVAAGDVIAIIGNSGERSQGPHLHFEIWRNQTPVNPSNYLIINP